MNRMRWTTLRLLVLAVVPTAATGCGHRTAEFNPKVEGTLTVDGAPLAQAMVQFVPEPQADVDAPPSTAMTDANGHFRLTHDRNQPGAAIGKHHVVILQGRGGANPDDPQAPLAPPPPGPKLPQVYTLVGKTPLEIEVTADNHTYDVTATAQQSAAGGNPFGKD